MGEGGTRGGGAGCTVVETESNAMRVDKWRGLEWDERWRRVNGWKGGGGGRRALRLCVWEGETDGYFAIRFPLPVGGITNVDFYYLQCKTHRNPELKSGIELLFNIARWNPYTWQLVEANAREHNQHTPPDAIPPHYWYKYVTPV